MGIIKAGVYEIPRGRFHLLEYISFVEFKFSAAIGGLYGPRFSFDRIVSIPDTLIKFSNDTFSEWAYIYDYLISVENDQEISDAEYRIWSQIGAIKLTPVYKMVDGTWKKLTAFNKINGEWQDMAPTGASTNAGDALRVKGYISINNLTGTITYYENTSTRTTIDFIEGISQEITAVVGSKLRVDTTTAILEASCVQDGSIHPPPLEWDTDRCGVSITILNKNFTLSVT